MCSALEDFYDIMAAHASSCKQLQIGSKALQRQQSAGKSVKNNVLSWQQLQLTRRQERHPRKQRKRSMLLMLKKLF